MAAGDPEVAGGEEREVGHHRLVRPPGGRGQPAVDLRGRPGGRWRPPACRLGTRDADVDRSPCRAGGRWPGTTTAPCAARSSRRPRARRPASCSRRRSAWRAGPAGVPHDQRRAARPRRAGVVDGAARGGRSWSKSTSRPVDPRPQRTGSRKSRLNPDRSSVASQRDPGPPGEPSAARTRSGRARRSAARRCRRCRRAGSTDRRSRRSPRSRASTADEGRGRAEREDEGEREPRRRITDGCDSPAAPLDLDAERGRRPVIRLRPPPGAPRQCSQRPGPPGCPSERSVTCP